jgi:NUDIX domain
MKMGDDYLFAGTKLPLQLIDGPGTYDPGDIEFLIDGDLELPPALRRSVEEMRTVMAGFKGETVLFDGPCYVVAEEPKIARRWSADGERASIQFRVARTTYFVRVLCRGALNAEVSQYLQQHWNEDSVPPASALRFAEDGRDAFSPLRYAGLGVNISMVAFDRKGEPWVVVQRRGSRTAEVTGAWATSLHESISTEDVVDGGQLDPWRTVVRCAREELGISLRTVTFHAAMVDKGQEIGEGIRRSGGFELIGSCEVAISAEHLQDLHTRGRDSFERESLRIVPLSVAGVSELLIETGIHTWYPSALASLLETLELYVPGGWLRVSEQLAELWSGQ